MDSKIHSTRNRIASVVQFVITTVIFLFFMFPFYMVVLNSFKSKRDIVKTPLAWGGKRGFTLDNYAEAFQKMDFLHVLGNSFIVTCTSVALIILFSSMCAYIFVRRNWKINKILYALMLFSMLISIYGGMFGMLNHRPTLIFMHVGFSMAMAVFMYYGFIRGSIPISLEEAAEIDGASRARTFFTIVLPLLKPTTATLIILYALALWNDYLLPSLILTGKELYTIPIATKLFQGAYGNSMDLLMAALVMAIIPVIILYLALQKYIIAGVVAGAVKS